MTEEESGQAPPPEVRVWPPGRAPDAGSRIETRCPNCRVEWWIARSLAGHRLRCACGSWIDVPRVESASLPADAPIAALEQARDIDAPVGWVKTPDYSRPPASHEPLREVGTGEAVGPGALLHATASTRRRWTNRGLLELAGVMAAFWGPMIALVFWGNRGDLLSFMPLTSLASAVLVVLIGATAPHYTFGGLVATKPRYFLEGVLTALAGAALAYGWVALIRNSNISNRDFTHDLRGELGLVWTLVLVGVLPAIFEEMAFRGLVQGRLTPLCGRNGAILITGAAFGLAHGVTLGFPFHISLGIYICWLRARSASLYPGMIVHLFYNSTLVFCLSG